MHDAGPVGWPMQDAAPVDDGPIGRPMHDDGPAGWPVHDDGLVCVRVCVRVRVCVPAESMHHYQLKVESPFLY